VLSSEIAASATKTTYTGVASSSTIFTLAPGIDYFVTRHFSVGAACAIRSAQVTGIDPSNRLPVSADMTGASALLRVGFDVPIATWLSFYPRASLSLGVDAYDQKSGDTENKYTENVLSLGVYAPLLVHVAPHAFLGFGPSVAQDLERANQRTNSEDRSTSAGAGLIVGGWIE
jgi:hypothetical protein